MFNPRDHAWDVLNAFNRFVRKFGYTYAGENRTPPAAYNTFDSITPWKNQDKARLFLSKAVTDEFLDDFESTVPVEERISITFDDLVFKMKERYTPNTNIVCNHYLFHRILQNPSENFDDFVHRVNADAQLCVFKCENKSCDVQDTLICDQIIVGTSCTVI